METIRALASEWSVQGFPFMPVYSLTNESHRWVAIVRAECEMEAVIVTLLAMDGMEQDAEEVHLHTQDGNKDAAARLGDRELIGWHLKP